MISRPDHGAASPALPLPPAPDSGAVPGADPDRDFSLRAPPSPARRAAFLAIACLVFAGFLALAWWQVERRAWKLDLIARVEQRVHAAPAPAPGPPSWPRLDAASDEYRRVEAKGSFLYDQQTLVQASTDLGGGFWVMTPLRMAGGGIVLVNRGFVAPQAADAIRMAAHGAKPDAAPSAPAAVTGLLRMSQPGGGFLRRNDAAAGRWYSRDVQAIAAARGLHGVAPYFIDADAVPAGVDAGRAPIGGLTVIAFPNNHLVYAVTWLALALMTAGAAWRALRGRRAWHPRREPPILRAGQGRGERKDGNDGDAGNVH